MLDIDNTSPDTLQSLTTSLVTANTYKQRVPCAFNSEIDIPSPAFKKWRVKIQSQDKQR